MGLKDHLKSIKEDFQNSTITQLQHWANSRSIKAAILWFSTLLFALIIISFEINSLLIQMRNNASPVKITIQTSVRPFPSITFCNLSPYKRSEIHKVHDLETLNNLVEYMDEQMTSWATGKSIIRTKGCPAISNQKVYRIINRLKPSGNYLSITKSNSVQLEMRACGDFDQFWAINKTSLNPNDCKFTISLLSRSYAIKPLHADIAAGSVTTISKKAKSFSAARRNFNLEAMSTCSGCFAIKHGAYYLGWEKNSTTSQGKGVVKLMPNNLGPAPYQWLFSEVGTTLLINWLPNGLFFLNVSDVKSFFCVEYSFIAGEMEINSNDTICAQKAVVPGGGSKTVLAKHTNDGLIKILNLTTSKDSVWMQSTLLDSLPYVTSNLSDNMRLKLGFQISDVMLVCSFGRVPCNMTQDILVWNNRASGNCFTFNHADSTTLKYANRAGRDYGLRVKMKTVQSDYMNVVISSGIIMSINDVGEQIFPETERRLLSSGLSVDIALTYTESNKLSKPNEECVNDQAYSVEICWRTCYQEHLRQYCGCYDPRYDIPRPKVNNASYCVIEKRFCIIQQLSKKHSHCKCKSKCSNKQYRATSTYALLTERSANAERLHIGKKEFLEVNVYHRSTAYRIFNEYNSYEFVTFLSDIAGLSGIYFGISFISCFEVFVAVYKFGRLLLCRRPV